MDDAFVGEPVKIEQMTPFYRDLWGWKKYAHKNPYIFVDIQTSIETHSLLKDRSSEVWGKGKW